MRYDYSRPLKKEHVHVHILNLSKRKDIPEIMKGIKDASWRYNFEFQQVGDFLKRPDDSFRIRLLIIVAGGSFDSQLSARAIQFLQHYNCISIAFEYDSEEHMYSFEDKVEQYKALSEDRINFLRPIEYPGGRMIVPAAKIVDNSICDSVRIKYKAVCKDNAVLDLPHPIRSFFKQASDVYRDYHLYHRSASDGYFAVRAIDNPAHFYVTSTKTYKTNMDFARIAKVTAYDPGSNILEYEGAFLPSSDSVEAAITFKEMPEVNNIVHTHASRLFTRNPDFLYKVTVPIAPYGEVETGQLVVRALQNETDGFIIMEDHGEVFTGKVHAEVSRTLLGYLRRKEPVSTLEKVSQ